MYKQLMNEPYCMLASDIDKLTFVQLVLYFRKDEEVRGVRKLSQNEVKKILKDKSKENITREEFLRRGEEIRKKKKAEMQKRKQERLAAAKGGKRDK